MAINEVPGVPDVSADWYRSIVGLAHELPTWVRDLGGFLTENLLMMFGVLFLVAVWRARGRGPRAMVLALSAPAAMLTAYAISEAVKGVLREDRPCRAVPDISRTILECPEYGDWSLPSNHSTLAASAAVALVIVWRRVAVVAAILALLEGFSRVFVGVHYPHDVLGGFLLGSVVAVLVMFVVSKVLLPPAERALARRRPVERADDAPTGPVLVDVARARAVPVSRETGDRVSGSTPGERPRIPGRSAVRGR